MPNYKTFHTQQMETTEHWNNSYLLTDQLNGIICTKFPEMSSLFSVQVPARKLNHIKVGFHIYCFKNLEHIFNMFYFRRYY